MKVTVLLLGGIVLVIVGLFFWSGGQLITLEYRDFPQSELEKLRVPEGWTPPGELSFSGLSQVEARSPWTRWAMKLFAGTFMVDTQIAHRLATLVFDTGAALTVLSPEIAVAAQVPLIREGPKVTHWDQQIPTYLGWLRELKIAGLSAHNVPVLVMGKQPTLKVLGLKAYRLNGMLGMSVMKGLAVTLDWRTGTVTFHREPPQLKAPSAPLRIFEQELQGGVKALSPTSEGFLDGAGPYMIVIDTGTSFAEILISDELLQALGWAGKEKIFVQHLQLGEIELREVVVIPARAREAMGAKLSGPVMLVGNGLFQSKGFRRLTLDFLAGRLYAER